MEEYSHHVKKLKTSPLGALLCWRMHGKPMKKRLFKYVTFRIRLATDLWAMELKQQFGPCDIVRLIYWHVDMTRSI